MKYQEWEALMKSEDGEFVYISKDKKRKMYREYKRELNQMNSQTECKEVESKGCIQ